MIAARLYEIFHQASLKRPVFILYRFAYSRKQREKKTKGSIFSNSHLQNLPNQKISQISSPSPPSSNSIHYFFAKHPSKKKIFKPVRNVYTYEQRLESLKRIRSARRGGGADRSARGRLKRSKFGKRGLHPTTGCQWRGIGSKGHATMRPRSKEKLAVSTRGGGFAIGLHPFGLLAVCSHS